MIRNCFHCLTTQRHDRINQVIWVNSFLFVHFLYWLYKFFDVELVWQNEVPKWINWFKASICSLRNLGLWGHSTGAEDELILYIRGSQTEKCKKKFKSQPIKIRTRKWRYKFGKDTNPQPIKTVLFWLTHPYWWAFTYICFGLWKYIGKSVKLSNRLKIKEYQWQSINTWFVVS